jgi:hypothetical protein
MAKFNASQFKNKMRNIQNQYNREMRKVERKLNQGINNYNRAVRKYNTELRHNQSKIKSELAKLQRNSTVRVRSNYEISVISVNQSYNQLKQKYDFNEGGQYIDLLQGIEEENANNLEVANVVFNNDETDNEEYSLEDTLISNNLLNISEDLNNRWMGAIYALNPKNPDATRHFCTSTREIFIQIIDTKAKEDDVIKIFPNCEKTDNGSVTRRSKIKYLLYQKGVNDVDMEEFIHSDIENILSLLYELNGGTHGKSGKYTLNQLKSIKKRAERGLNFLCKYVV